MNFTRFKFKFASALTLMVCAVFVFEASAQEAPAEKRRYISLTVGLTHDEEMPYIPKDAQFKGDFRKFTKVEFAQELHRLRFTPKNNVGIGTLTVHDAKGDKLFEIIIDVKKSNLAKIAQEIQSLLGEIEGINVKILNNKVLVDGQVLLPRDV